MATKLGEILVQAGKITQAELEETLQCQVIFGGRLGTNLIEMGYLTELELANFLSKKLRAPIATQEQMMSVPPEIISLIPRELAEKHRIIPLALDKKRLTIATMDPHDLPSIDTLSFVTGYTIQPVIATEVRMTLALEKHYDIKRKERHGRLWWSNTKRSRKEDEQHALLAKPNYFAPQEDDEPIELPPIEEFRGFDQYPEETAPAPPPPVEAAPTPPPVEAAPTPPPVEAAAPPAPPADAVGQLSMDDVAEQLAEAGDRDAIAETIIGYTCQRFDCAALFLIRGKSALGWRGTRNDGEIPEIEELEISLDTPSALQFAVENRRFFLGPITDTPANTKMLSGLGERQPEASLLLPLMLMNRVVAVLYLTGRSDELTVALLELQRLLGKAALAFEILLLKNKILSA